MEDMEKGVILGSLLAAQGAIEAAIAAVRYSAPEPPPDPGAPCDHSSVEDIPTMGTETSQLCLLCHEVL